MSSNPYDEILKGYSPMSDTTDTSAYDAILTPTKKSPYDDIIQSAAQAHGLDPDLIRATMRQESTFKPNAKSPKGASGLMQLMPDTARTLGVKNIYDPKENIYGGAKYLKQQLDKFGGDVPKALAAYNAGPGAVVKYGDIPPYKETQDYVKRITGNYKGKGYANTPDPYESILSGYTPQQDTPPADIPRSAPPPTNPVDVMPTQTQLPPPPTPMGVNDQLMPEGLSTRPAPESPDTLKAQMQAALNPKVKDRSAVLTTEPSQNAIFQNSGFTPIQVQQGTLWVNPAKARKLKLRTPQDIQMFVENNPDGMTRLIGKVENVGDNTGGNQPVVHTTAPDGTELSSSVVTNPETAAKQVDVDKKSFPDSRTQITTTDQVALKRQQGTQATAPPQKVNFATSEPTISDVPQEPPTEVIDPKNEQQVNAATANLIKFPQTMKSVDDANAYIRSQLQALYPQGDFSKVNLLTPGAFGNGKDIGGVQATFGLLKNAGVDVAPLIAQKVAENRVENPELAKIHLDRAVPNAKELGEKVKEATRIPLFGYSDAPSGLFGGLVQNVGDFGGMLAGSIKASPSYGAINEILSNGGTRPVKAVDPTAEALMDFYDSANAFSEATGAKDADGKDTIPTILFKGIGQTPEYAMMSALPGGLVTGIPLKNSLLARAKDKPWNEVVKETGWGIGEGALFTFLPKGVQKLFGVDTSLLKTIGRVGTEVAGISGGTYGMETLKNPDATPEDKLKSAISIGLFHLYGATHGSLKGEVAHVVDAKNNLDAYVKIEGPNKFTFVEKQKPDIELAIPKPADKLSGDFASQPEKGFQITGGKSDNPAIVSPEENAAMLAKKATEPENITTNGSGGGSDSVEALNRLESEKNAGLTRVVVDTRSKTERPLIGVDAVDYTPKPHESIEYRGGGRNGEVIAQGDKVSPAYSPPERDVVKTEAKAETKTAEPDVYEINADELAPEKPATKPAEKPIDASKTNLDLILDRVTKENEVTIKLQDNISREQVKRVEDAAKDRGMTASFDGHNILIRKAIDVPKSEESKPIKEGSTVYNASGKEGEVVGKDGDNLLVQWTKPNGEMDGEPVPVRPDKVSTTKATAETNVAEKPVETKTVEKPVETKPLAKGQKVTYLGKEWEIAADPVNGKVTLKDSTGRGKLVSVDKVVPAEGLPDTQIKDILGDEPVTPKNAMAKAEEIVNAEDQRSASQNERNVTANESKGGGEGAIEKPNTSLTESKADAIPKPSEPVKGESPKPIETGNAKAPIQDVKETRTPRTRKAKEPETAPINLNEGERAKILNRFTKQGDLAKYRRKFQALTVDGKQRAIELVHSGMDANKAIREAKKSPYPTDLKGAVDNFKATVEDSSKDIKGESLATPEDIVPRDRSGERGTALIPSATQLRELGRAILDVPSRDWYQRIKEPIEKMMAQHRAVRDVEFASERLKIQTERAMDGMTPDERTAIIDAMEHDYQGKYMDALDARQKAIAMELKPVHDMIQDYNQRYDVFTEREQPAGVRHLFHWWIDPKTDRPFSTNFGEFAKTGPSSKQRTIETYAEGRTRAENPLKMASVNPGEILGKSYEQMVRVKEARDLVDHLKTWELTDPDGTQLKGIVSEPPKGMEDRYVALDVPALNRSKFLPNGEGKPGILVKEPAFILKELAPKIEAYFNHPDWGKADEIFGMLRSIKLAGTFFHGLGLMFKNNIMFRIRSIHDIKNGLEQQRNMDDTMKILHRNGLDTALKREYTDIAEASGHFRKSTMMGRFSDFIVHKNPMTKLVFGVVRVGLKNAYAHDVYPKQEALYLARAEKLKGSPLTQAEIARTQNIAARAVVKRADSLFSGEDGRMGALEASKAVTQYYFNPTAQRIWSAALISKTWQREHIIEAKNLTKSLLMPKTMGPIAREHVKELIGVAAMMSIADVYNYFMTQWMDKKGTHLWDNPSGSKFSMRLPWNEPEYKNANGKTVAGGPAHVRPFKAITEVPELIAAFAPGERGDIVDKVSSKLNPGIGAVVNQLSYSGTHKKPGYLGRTEQLITDLAPIAFTVPVQVGRERRNPWDLVPWALGAGLQKPIQTKSSKEELAPEEKNIKRRENLIKRREKFQQKLKEK